MMSSQTSVSYCLDSVVSKAFDMMKIAIVNLTGGGMSGGYQKYLQNIIPRIATNPAVEAILCASPESLNVQNWFDQFHNVGFISCRPFHFLQSGLDSDLKQYLEDFLPDVIFLPIERYFRFENVPVVNMIRNMEPLIYPYEGNPVSEKLRNWLRKQNARKAVNKANRAIAVSDFVKSFLIDSWGISSDKIGVVYHGINLPIGNEGVRPFSIPQNWEGIFLFSAGSIRPARGLEDILFALGYMVSHNMEIPEIVIAGESSANMIDYQRKLKGWLKKRGLASKICWAGNLNEKEMAWCYQNCNAFVMTSRVEACPNIAMEAMSHGCACISSDNPPLSEFFRDTAVYYPTKNGKTLADAIKTVLAWDDNQRKVMSEKAKKRAAEFSWDVCAEKTVAELAKAVGKQEG